MLTRKQIDNRGKKRAELLAQIDVLQRKVDAIDDEMKAECEKLGVEELTGEKFIVRWAKQIQRRFNSEAFRKDHKDLYEAYRFPDERRPFSFRELTEKGKAEVKASAAKAGAAA